MTVLTVTSMKSERSKHTDYQITVKSFNEHTEKYETIWTMTRSEPFEARIQVEQLVGMTQLD